MKSLQHPIARCALILLVLVLMFSAGLHAAAAAQPARHPALPAADGSRQPAPRQTPSGAAVPHQVDAFPRSRLPTSSYLAGTDDRYAFDTGTSKVSQAPVAQVDPLPQYSPASFLVSWSATGSSYGIRDYDVQVRDGSGSLWTNWQVVTTRTSATYTGQNGHVYYFRSRARDNAGSTGAYSSLSIFTTVDAVAPQAQILSLPPFADSPLHVAWAGSDAGAGLSSFDVQIRDAADGSWHDWLVETGETTAAFSGLDGHIYGFRIRATDRAGNTSLYTDQPGAEVTVDTRPPAARVTTLAPYAPGTLTISWGGSDGAGSGVASYDVQVRDGADGAWQDWQTATHATAGQFTGEPGHTYYFRGRATDRIGHLGAWAGEDGDAYTSLYAWAMTGMARDNRDTPLSGVTIATTPLAMASSRGADADDGSFAVCAAPAVGAYSATWSKNGYGTLPPTDFTPTDGGQWDVVLPPGDDIMLDGGFERGRLQPAWEAQPGSAAPAVVAGARHTGLYGTALGNLPSGGAQAGQSALEQTLSVPMTLTNPTLSFFYEFSGSAGGQGEFGVTLTDGVTEAALARITRREATGWQHGYLDLSQWRGQQVALTFYVDQVAGDSPTWAYLDDVSLGSSYPDLWVQPEAAAALPGQQVTYRIHYGDRGGVPASSVTIAQALPPELRFVAATPAPASQVGQQITWQIGSLAGGAATGTILVTGSIAGTAAPFTSYPMLTTLRSTSSEPEQDNNVARTSLFTSASMYLPAVTR